MGNSALRKLAVLEERQLNQYRGSTVAIDAHHWLHRYMSGMTRYMDPEVYQLEDGTEVVNLVALFRGLPPLLRKNITPTFVFDGTPHQRKEETVQNRRGEKKKAEQKMKEATREGDLEAMRKYKSRTQSLTPTVHETTREMLDKLGIPYLEAGGDGEAYAAHLVKEGYADAVMTDDYDALLFGSPQTIRQYAGGGPAEAMLLKPTLQNHGITQEELVDIALLCGTDFNDGVSGIGPKRGVKYISSGETIKEILERKNATIEGLNELRSLFLNPDINLLPVSQPTLKSPDLDQARSYARTWELPNSFIETNIERFPRY